MQSFLSLSRRFGRIPGHTALAIWNRFRQQSIQNQRRYVLPVLYPGRCKSKSSSARGDFFVALQSLPRALMIPQVQWGKNASKSDMTIRGYGLLLPFDPCSSALTSLLLTGLTCRIFVRVERFDEIISKASKHFASHLAVDCSSLDKTGVQTNV